VVRDMFHHTGTDLSLTDARRRFILSPRASKRYSPYYLNLPGMRHCPPAIRMMHPSTTHGELPSADAEGKETQWSAGSLQSQTWELLNFERSSSIVPGIATPRSNTLI
jgi:hypothetical protein